MTSWPNIFNRQFCRILWTTLLLSTFSVTAEPVHLQLRWHHQFQFAGYYAALEKGYYQSAGLEVIIHDGSPDKKPIPEVLKGHAQFGEANGELLLERLRGKPLVALAAIYQHSASVLLARKDANIAAPEDLVGKKVMMMENTDNANFIAMFHNEGIDMSRLHAMPSSYNVQDLIDGKVDAFNSYISNEPFFLKQQGIDYTLLNPSNYGVDFYSDVLFTTEQNIKQNPELVKAFVEASLEGWRYALAHPQEIIDLLIDKYHVPKTRAHLEYEADTIKSLILPELIEIGHMNPWRWQHMADTFINACMVQNDQYLQGFIYNPDPVEIKEDLLKYLRIVGGMAILASVIILLQIKAYRKIKQENRLRIAAEAEIKKLAFQDALTGLANRHHFFVLANQALKLAHREQLKCAVLFIDLNDFKQINDKFGHKAGDLVLTHIGHSLRQFIRKSDIAARLGGDEFALLLNNIKSKEDLFQSLEKIQNSVCQPISYNSHELSVSASIGLAIYPDDAENIDDLLDAADMHMYQIKFEDKRSDDSITLF
jgi:diguanylate cyclase (GGDEF)-like protein